MIIKEVGFRPVYHLVCAFELNDKLKEIIKDCPDAAKASHAVVYGYIDPKEGLMLEILGAGKQAPKYFYFKDPYEGEKITIKASEVEDVEFMYFPDLEPRFQKKFAPRIAELKKYDASKELEETRELGFLDPLRSPQYPDDIRVVLTKDGLKAEEVWVHMTNLGDHMLVGTLLNQPYQDYGVNKGDSLEFSMKETDDKKILCYKDMNGPHKLCSEDLEDGSFLKEVIQEFLKNTDNKETFAFLLAVLRSSGVVVPCDVQPSEEDSLDGKEAEKFQAGMHFLPSILESDGHKFIPVFTNVDEIGDHAEDAARVNMSFLAAIEMALDAGNAIEGIVTTNTRIRQLVEETTTPKNRDEQEIAGYRDVLNVIHENFDAIPITKNYILQLHKILYSHMNNPIAGQTKNVQNYISATYPDGHTEILFTPLAPFETPEALDRICEEYNLVIGNFEVEPLIAIPIFIHDFLCIHPFNDGNGRMSRLLTTLLLYRSGFYVGKYISLEAKIAKNKDLYYKLSDDEYEQISVKLIPYSCHANRGESDMIVWFNLK